MRGFSAKRGDDDGAYLNIVFAVEHVANAWKLLRPKLFDSTEFGESLKVASLTMCTGEDGWNDYLLLHHFDPEIPLDATGEA